MRTLIPLERIRGLIIFLIVSETLKSVDYNGRPLVFLKVPWVRVVEQNDANVVTAYGGPV